MTKNVIHVVGTGTIGEPLIALLCDLRVSLGIDEVTFFKNTPRRGDRPLLEQLTKRGARLAARHEHVGEFRALGFEVAFEAEEAIKRATVVIDCTPSDMGLENKEKFYKKYADQVSGFVAQGSEEGFGTPYARGINDRVLEDSKDQFIQVVSCNTHNISVLVQTLAAVGGGLDLEDGRFVCLRRANDISQDSGFIPAPKVGKHDDPIFGTHHAKDANRLFKTMGHDLKLFSSACMLNSQYMHAMHFSLRLGHKVTREDVISRFRDNPRVAVTEKTTANSIFSFGREHGHHGRILSQTVVALPTLTVRDEHEVVGFCFTPQDGNSLMSSVAAAMWFIDPGMAKSHLGPLRAYLFQEV